jgi:hypothetical protein
VEDDVAAGNRMVHRIGVKDGSLDQAEPAAQRREPLRRARREIIQDRHFVSARQEAPDEVVADEPSATGDQRPHATVT